MVFGNVNAQRSTWRRTHIVNHVVNGDFKHEHIARIFGMGPTETMRDLSEESKPAPHDRCWNGWKSEKASHNTFFGIGDVYRTSQRISYSWIEVG